MLRLRLLRLLMPALIVALGALLWFSFKPQPTTARVTDAGETPQQTVATDVNLTGFADVDAADVEKMTQQSDGSLLLNGIKDLKFPRPGRGPLLVSAGSGDRDGEDGPWKFGDEIVFSDPQEGLRLELSNLEIDQEIGVARSQSEVRFSGRGITGTGTGLEYWLDDQPAVLHQPRLADGSGGQLFGERAFLNDGLRDIEIVGAVRAEQSGKRLATSRLRMIRDAEDQLRQVLAGGGVQLEWESGTDSPAKLNGNELEVLWDAAGEPESFLLEGDASFLRDAQSLTADSLSADRIQQSWRVEASGNARLSATTEAGPSRLAADVIRSVLDDAMRLREGEAEGHITFDSPEIRAEALRATFRRATSGVDVVELFGDALNKAWLARPRNRVAAAAIRTDLAGSELHAEGAVEATLLPKSSTDAETEIARGQTRLFLEGQAVHFVAESLDSREGGEWLQFAGQVRGWQGERNLSGDEVQLNQRTNAMTARGNVATRLPRDEKGPATSAADFLQINADQLEYDDSGGSATYTGHVRVRLDEGWLEADRMLVSIGVESRRIEQIQAFGAVRLELNRRSDGALTHPISGSADRLTYLPADSTVVLFGLESPAIVRRQGEGGGTTKGRELHYRLDTEALEVISGSQDAGTIRS